MTNEAFKPRKELRIVPETDGAVLLRAEFLRDFAHEASRVKPGGEVSTLAMYIGAGEAADAVLNVFSSIPTAIRSQVEMHEYHDDYSRVMGPDNEIYAFDDLLPWRREEVKNNKGHYDEMMQQFQSLGVKSHVLNKVDGAAEFFPMTDRTHLKGSFVKNGDQSVFYIQTGNHEVGPRDDFFIKITGEPANRLIDVFKEVVENGGPSEDTIYRISDMISVYYDSGKKGESLILRKARELVDGAKKSIKNISLFYPDGIREQLSEAVKRKVDVEVIATKYYLDGFGINIANIFYLIDKAAEASSRIRRDKFNVTRDPFSWAHAKTLVIDEEDEKNAVAFIGSCNLSASGVKAGTKEWQFLIKDKQIIKGLARRFQDLRASIEAEASGI